MKRGNKTPTRRLTPLARLESRLTASVHRAGALRPPTDRADVPELNPPALPEQETTRTLGRTKKSDSPGALNRLIAFLL